jgi:4-hydroxy-tetrahydrodipicolinate reductase
MVNGTPGKMGISVSQAVLARGGNVNLVPFSLAGESADTNEPTDIDGFKVRTLKPSEREDFIKEIVETYTKNADLVCIDYTHPSAVNSNAEFYIKHNIPFVMGTTDGDRDKLMSDVKSSNIYSVIAPNMGKQVVAF